MYQLKRDLIQRLPLYYKSDSMFRKLKYKLTLTLIMTFNLVKKVTEETIFVSILSFIEKRTLMTTRNYFTLYLLIISEVSLPK